MDLVTEVKGTSTNYSCFFNLLLLVIFVLKKVIIFGHFTLSYNSLLYYAMSL